MEYLHASAIMAKVPEMELSLPVIGVLDVAPFVTATVIFILITALFALIRKVVLVRLEALFEKTNTDIDDAIIDAIRGIRPWAYSVVALFISLQFFTLPQWAEISARVIFLFTVVWQAIEIALAFVRLAATRLIERDEDGDGAVDPGAETASHMVTLLARIVLWALGGLFVLSNLGVEITSLIAGLGIGGVAVAFALQGILSDLFASFSIYFDKPFRIGDFVTIGNDSGTIEKIGIKSTRIRALTGEELVVSNAELTTARVQNYKKMAERRIAFRFGITYDATSAQIESALSIVKSIFEGIENTRLDRVHFFEFGDSALNFEVVYYVDSPAYDVYLDIQQRVNLMMMQKFESEGIEFAYPTRTVYVKNS